MKVKDIYELINAYADFSAQSSWDNSGMLVGSMEDEVKGIVFATDATSQVVEYAKNKNCNLIVTHHPVIFEGLKKVEKGSVVYKLIKADINIICAHTNLDLAPKGVNYALAEKLGVKNCVVLEHEEGGFGLAGEIEKELTPKEFAERIEKALGMAPRYNAVGAEKIKYVGMCSGSGGDLCVSSKEKYGHKYTAFVTADVKNNYYIEAAEHGITLYDCGHNATERVIMPLLKEYIAENTKDIPLYIADVFDGFLLQ